MIMKELLSSSGYVFNTDFQIWHRLGFEAIAYNDGDHIEASISKIVKNAADVSVFSKDLKQHCKNWSSTYHLSSTRVNILRPFKDIFYGADVLEIGAGCGAITRYLGESNANVIALEGSYRRATIARSRTRDLKNVEVVAERFDQFECDKKFDVITLIGVLEYANLFTSGDNPALSMLQRAQSLLKPEGKLIIAIENQLGLKYFAGVPEDHLDVAMYGIEGRYRENQPQTFGRKVLTDLLNQAGFSETEFLAPFPDYKLPISIVTESGFSFEFFDAAAFAWQSVRSDPQLPKYLGFSPELVWPQIIKNGIGLDLANSFLIVATKLPAQEKCPTILAYHFSTSRESCYCKETVFYKTDCNEVELQYRMLDSGAQNAHNNGDIKFSIPPKAKYSFGKLLSLELIEIVTQKDWSIENVGHFLMRYLDLIRSLASTNSNNFDINSVHSPISGQYFDMVPQNIVIGTDQSVHFIDKEWELSDDMPVGWLIFRTLLLLVQSVSRFGESSHQYQTRMAFFISAFKAAGLEADENDINIFADKEAIIQAKVSGRPLSECLNWYSDSQLPYYNLSQIACEQEGQLLLCTNDIKLLAAQRDEAFTLNEKLLAETKLLLSQRDEAFALNEKLFAETKLLLSQRDEAFAVNEKLFAETKILVTQRDQLHAIKEQLLIEKKTLNHQLNSGIFRVIRKIKLRTR
ncbi:MAG: class I SAM-dependent methyltransferase [Methylococcales bacterium]